MPRRNVTKVRPQAKKRMPMRKNVRKTRRVSRIPRSMSTLPFPPIRQAMLVYKVPTVPLLSSAITGTYLAQFRCTDMYDFDVSDTFSNKQPLYFDQLLSPVGPYKNYKVNAWKQTITVTNLTDRALQAYYDPGAVNSFSDSDTIVELQNRPYVQNKLITAQANSKPQHTFSAYRTLKQFVPKIASSGLDYVGGSVSTPTATINSTLLLTNVDSSSLSQFQISCSMTHVFYVTLYNNDSLIS